MRSSHGRLRPDPVDARARHDGLFQGEGTGEEVHQERDPLLQALYTESLHARGDVDAVDRLLDAHREAFGDPEQVAYARQQDERHDRALPLPNIGRPLRPSLERYLDEHRGWNPATQRECYANQHVQPRKRKPCWLRRVWSGTEVLYLVLAIILISSMLFAIAMLAIPAAVR